MAGPLSARSEHDTNPRSSAFHEDAALVEKAGPPTQRSPQERPWLTTFEWQLLAASTIVKVLLFPTYHSTDFEVHRNWLAITHSLPIRDWYFESTSQWTLDYPPFFAYLSWVLAQFSVLVDPRIANLHEGLEYAGWSCKAFMRCTVVATELVLAAALVAHSRLGPRGPADKGSAISNRLSTTHVLAASLLMHPGLIIIDHIHFQYNGFLFGILAWSLWAAREGKPLLCAFLFSSLLNLKHIYVYVASPFLIYLLRAYVYPVGSHLNNISRPLERLLAVGVVTLIPFVLSLAPLVVDGMRHELGPLGVIMQMISRLFPFSRGLIHAYWAPNAWALWTFSDRILVKALQKVPVLREYLPAAFSTRYDALAATGFASASRGLVEHVSFGILPEIKPSMCFLLTLSCCLLYMVKLWKAPTYYNFLTSISLCGFASFLFGWHVHEKAVMLILVPYTLLAGQDYGHARTFVILSTSGIVSLFPLLFQPAEGPIKIIYSLVWAIIVFGTLRQRVYRPVQSNIGMMIHGLETMYLWGFIALQLYVSVVHPVLFQSAPASVDTLPSRAQSTYLARPAAIAVEQHPSEKSSTLAGPSYVEIITAMPTDTTSDVEHKSNSSTVHALTEEVVRETAGSSAELLSSSTDPTFDSAPPPTIADIVSAPEPVPAATPQEADIPTISTAAHVASEATTAPYRNSRMASHTSSQAMEFLPLMLVSVYCSLGVVWTWLRASVLYFRK